MSAPNSLVSPDKFQGLCQPERFRYTIKVNNNSNPQLITILSRLNQIGASINHSESGDLSNLDETLSLIVESASEVVLGSSAVIYTYDSQRRTFDISSRVASEKHDISRLDDAPRTDGMGASAVLQKSRILSYEMSDSEINPARVDQGAKAVACYPLMVANEILGALYVYLHEPRTFNDLELLMLDNFVNLTAMTLSTAQRITQAQQEQSRKERELRRIRRAGRLISSHTSFNDTLDMILRMALEVTEARYGIFRLVNKNGTHLDTRAFVGDGQRRPATESLPIDECSITGTVAVRREPLIVEDVSEEPWNRIYYPFDRKLVMRSELAVPLIGASGRLEGVLNLESPRVNAFSKQDRYIMQILATQAVAAIQEVRLLNMLQEITTLLLTQPLQAVHQNLVDKACDLLNVPCALLWLRDEDHFVVQATSIPDLLGWRINFSSSHTGKALIANQPTIAIGAPDDLPENLISAQEYGLALIAPLFAPDESQETQNPIGVFSVYYPYDESQDIEQADWDKNVLDILAQYASLAIQNAEHQAAVRQAQERHTMTEAFAAIGDIASNLLHQLNNKIGTIPVRIEGIQDKSSETLRGDSYLNSNLNEIQRSATDAIQVVRENLFLLRPINFSEVAPKDTVRSALETYPLPSKVRIFHQNLGNLPKVLACPQRLPLVFVNLFDNAVRVMQGQGEIFISGIGLEDKVEIRVKDSGPGIPPDLHDQIFEFNYSTQSQEHSGNLGFGLWWVKTLMARFGGSIQVESDGHSGTTFILVLPIAGAAA
jgi:signal transduction histidine kinase/transcriptional regulator with GAF, ATPase, and Fis domain